MTSNKTPLSWILVLVGIGIIIFAIIISKPAGEMNGPPVDGLVSDDSPRVQTFEQMLLVGENAIFVDNQASGAKEVVVGLVILENPGYVVIHANDDGLPGEIIGVSGWVIDGAEHFFVNLDEELQDGEIYYAMLHSDNGDQNWSPANDVPVTDSDDNVILMTFTATEGANPQAEAVMP